jgi:hypothetical protein
MAATDSPVGRKWLDERDSDLRGFPPNHLAMTDGIGAKYETKNVGEFRGDLLRSTVRRIMDDTYQCSIDDACSD